MREAGRRSRRNPKEGKPGSLQETNVCGVWARDACIVSARKRKGDYPVGSRFEDHTSENERGTENLAAQCLLTYVGPHDELAGRE